MSGRPRSARCPTDPATSSKLRPLSYSPDRNTSDLSAGHMLLFRRQDRRPIGDSSRRSTIRWEQKRDVGYPDPGGSENRELLTDNPLRRASAAWLMRTLESRGACPGALGVGGSREVVIGRRLQGDELEESLRRGGEGVVAEFESSPGPSPRAPWAPPVAGPVGSDSASSDDGPWLTLGLPFVEKVRPATSETTLYVRAQFQSPDGWGTRGSLRDAGTVRPRGFALPRDAPAPRP